MADQTLIDNFLNYLRITNFSEYTITNYKKDLEDFSFFIRGEKMAPSLDKVNRSKIASNYISYLSRANFSARSVNRKISSLRSFYNFLVSEGIIENNVFSEVSNVKTPKRLPSFVDSDDLIYLINNIDAKTNLGYRNKVLIEMMFATGIRVSEACDLQTHDVELYQGEIRIFGKGKKERVVYLYDELLEELKYYIFHVRPILLNKGDSHVQIKNLFINYKGGALTPRGVRKILNAEIENCALNLHITPHMLRHSFATAMLNSGLDLRSVQTLLGHENLSTTQIYTHVNQANIEEAFNKAFPRAKKEDS